MPIPNIQVHSNEGDSSIPEKPKPLIAVPQLSVDVDLNENESDSDNEDMMTAEEEAAARRYLSGGPEPEKRRMSSLDLYLLQPETKAESMIINRRLSLKQEQDDIEKMNSEAYQKEEERKRRERLSQEREEVKRARESKKQVKEKNECPSPSPRRRNYRKHGLGGMSRERRKKLKEMILQKAKEELNAERHRELQARDNHLKSVIPPFDLTGLDQVQLEERVKSWYSHVRQLEEQKIDWELRIRKQDEDIRELTMKLCDLKGKYHKPILRKVNKPTGILARLDKIRTINAMQNIDGEMRNLVERMREGHINLQYSPRINGEPEHADPTS